MAGVRVPKQGNPQFLTKGCSYLTLSGIKLPAWKFYTGRMFARSYTKPFLETSWR